MRNLKKKDATLGKSTPLTVEERIHILAAEWKAAKEAKEAADAEMKKKLEELEVIVAANRGKLLGGQKTQRLEGIGVKVGYTSKTEPTFNLDKFDMSKFAVRFPKCVEQKVVATAVKGLMKDDATKLLLEEFGVGIKVEESFTIEKA